MDIHEGVSGIFLDWEPLLYHVRGPPKHPCKILTEGVISAKHVLFVSKEFLAVGQRLSDRKFPGEKTIWLSSPSPKRRTSGRFLAAKYSIHRPLPHSPTWTSTAFAINPFARKVLQRELQIATRHIRPNTSGRGGQGRNNACPFVSVQNVGGWPEDQQRRGRGRAAGERRSFIYLCDHCPSLHLSSNHSCIHIHYIKFIFVYVTFTDSFICPCRNQFNPHFWKHPLTIHSSSHLLFHQLVHASNDHQSAFIYVPPPLVI